MLGQKSNVCGYPTDTYIWGLLKLVEALCDIEVYCYTF